MGKRSKKANAEVTVETTVDEALVMNHAEEASVAEEAMLEAAVETIEAVEGAQDGDGGTVLENEASTEAVSEPEAPSVTLDEQIASMSGEQVEEIVHATAKAIDERADFEKAKNPDNDSIQKHLTKSRKQLATHAAARIMLATNVSPEILNREKHTGSRYNVYAMGKLADLIGAASGGVISNKINFAIVKSLFAFRDAGVPFTSEIAKAAVSDKITIEKKMRDLLTRHTVSLSTASTQASSTLQALETLGVVSRVSSGRASIYELTEAPITNKLKDVLAKAA